MLGVIYVVLEGLESDETEGPRSGCQATMFRQRWKITLIGKYVHFLMIHLYKITVQLQIVVSADGSRRCRWMKSGAGSSNRRILFQAAAALRGPSKLLCLTTIRIPHHNRRNYDSLIIPYGKSTSAKILKLQQVSMISPCEEFSTLQEA